MKKRIKELRQALGLTQREFAEKVGVHPALVGNWESGGSKPGSQRVYQFCCLFGVAEQWIKDGTGPMFEKDKAAPSRREIQREFCKEVFRDLSPELQKIVIEAIKEETARQAAKHPENNRDNLENNE